MKNIPGISKTHQPCLMKFWNKIKVGKVVKTKETNAQSNFLLKNLFPN